jgi:hypothetical protein
MLVEPNLLIEGFSVAKFHFLAIDAFYGHFYMGRDLQPQLNYAISPTPELNFIVDRKLAAR